MNSCVRCGSTINRRLDQHPHHAGHDAVRITSSRESYEAVKDVPKAEDRRYVYVA